MKGFPFRQPLILDGSMGVSLIKRGMPQSACPEQWMLENPQAVSDILRSYVKAGAHAVYAPTFGANRIKLGGYGLAGDTAGINRELAKLARQAAGPDVLVGGDLTQLGIFLEPFGDAHFEELVEYYGEQVREISPYADFFVIETVATLSETRAAAIAVRENSKLPMFVTFTCDEHGKTSWGADIAACLIVLQSMGISAFGLNCSTGPKAMAESMRLLTPFARVPLIAKPNAGMPRIDENGNTVFDMGAEEFASFADEFAAAGVRLFGGCCGTDQTHISALSKKVESLCLSPFVPAKEDEETIPCANERTVSFIEPTIDVGEPIVCSPDLAEDILSAEEEPNGALKIIIESQDDLETFAQNQYMIGKALCLCSDSEELYEKALRVFNGRAFYDGTCGLEKPFLDMMSKKYGLVTL